ncbi:bestrophin family protein [Reichenbachiella carrageenanivorans]|uniref:Bestrophin family protein n=1 Tax=Reichenbachiella carrageenanivorans TaxID=2979869 RepID=A0ABY6D341_9BACT|nr:bestrophin family protein [Reichenbachiella carrageenanivorans]UXX80179.1 bestrophin family protein [Reichenbachiella carrageenanivorans]
MVEYNPKSWLNLLFHSYSRYVFKRLLPALLYVTVYTSIITYVFYELNIDFISTTSVHSILGIVLGFFLVFRTNGAYDRWWEGRKVWGELVNNTRNLAIKFSIMVPMNHPERGYISECISAYPRALKDHLREGVPAEVAAELVEKLKMENLDHIPNAIAKRLIGITNKLKGEKVMDPEQYRVLDGELKSLTDIMGKCERIRNTPIPYSYSMFMKKFIFAYIATLPFAFVTVYHYWTILIVVLILYILMSIELLAEEIEDPFGSDINDLPTDILAGKIDKNVKEIFG